MDAYLPRLSEDGKRWARFFGLLLVLVAAGCLIYMLMGVLTPVVAGLAIAYICNPAVTWAERRYHVPRVAIIATGLTLILLFAAALLLLGVLQVIGLAESVDSYVDQTTEWLRMTFPGIVEVDRQDVQSFASQYGFALGGFIVHSLQSLLGGAAYWTTFAILLPLFAFYFLLEFNEMVAWVRGHIPARFRDTVLEISATIDRSMSNFFRGRVIVCAIIGVLSGVGWALVGVKHSLLLGALAGVLNLVPFMSILALPLALLAAYVGVESGQSWFLPIVLTTAVFVAIQAIESFLLTPLIESQSSGLHPVTTVVALMVGGQLAGMLGMLLSIPLTSTLQSLAGRYLLPEVRRLAREKPEQTAPAETPDDTANDSDASPPAPGAASEETAK